MKNFVLYFITVLFISQSFSQVQVVDDVHAEPRKLEGSYNKIIVAGGIDVYLTQSDTEGLVVSASEEKYKDAIRAEIKENTLRVFVEGDKRWSFKNRNLRAYISFKQLSLLDVSGASDVVVAGKIAGADLTLKFSGASDFTGEVAVTSLNINLSGASDIKISGNATVLTINSSGASDVNGFGLTTETCKATASGASDIDISVKNELTAEASGSSEITYRGNPAIKGANKSGSSAIKKG